MAPKRDWLARALEEASLDCRVHETVRNAWRWPAWKLVALRELARDDATPTSVAQAAEVLSPKEGW